MCLQYVLSVQRLLAAWERRSPCCLGMEARWYVELTGVELTSGAELAAPVEKASAGRALVEKTDRGGRPRWAGGAMEREKDGQPR
jgi:hypothetical protein